MGKKNLQQLNDGVSQVKRHYETIIEMHDFIGDLANKERLVNESNNRLAIANELEQSHKNRLAGFNSEVDKALINLAKTQDTAAQTLAEANKEADEILQAANKRAEEIEHDSLNTAKANISAAQYDINKLGVDIKLKSDMLSKLETEVVATQDELQDLEVRVNKAKDYLKKLASSE